MPLHMEFTKVIEPIRDLYKDEVREVAGALGLPKEIQHRMPFPGPGLAVRVLGEVTREKVAVIREANWIVEDELVEKYRPWQCFAALLGLGTGVKGDNRIHGWIVAVRAVNSRDGMTADPVNIPFDHLTRIGSRITADIPSVARVVYDITAKPRQRSNTNNREKIRTISKRDTNGKNQPVSKHSTSATLCPHSPVIWPLSKARDRRSGMRKERNTSTAWQASPSAAPATATRRW